MTPIVQQLEARREALGMPFTILAVRAGVSRNTLHGVLRQGKDAKIATVAAIATALGCQIVFDAALSVEEMRAEQERQAGNGQSTGTTNRIWRAKPPE